MKINSLNFYGILLISLLAFIVGCDDEEATCEELVWYADTDNDGLGDADNLLLACEQPEGYVTNNDDDDDTVAACNVITWYQDLDGDGLGNPEVSELSCDQPAGYVDNSDDDYDNPTIFTLALEIDNGDRTATAYVQGFSDLTDVNTTVSFDGAGYEVESTNAARLFSLGNEYIYNMDYGSALLSKLTEAEGSSYEIVVEANAQIAIGTTNPRWKAVTEDVALLHNVVTETIVDENDEYVEVQGSARIMSVNLDDLTFSAVEEFVIPKTQTEIDNDFYTFRIDAPVVAGDKVYYGMQRFQYDPNGARIGGNHLNLQTLVLDYPSLQNPAVIEPGTSGVVGATNGYRTPSMYTDENGDVYQQTGSGPLVHSVNDEDTYFLKLSRGAYDDSYAFNFSQAISRNVGSTGWFYAGNGIGYVTYYDRDEYVATDGDYENIFWGVARVDLVNQTAVELNVPDGLYLLEYQSVVIENDQLYMVLAPIGQNGNVYIFDTTSESADGFTVGAEVETGASAFYIGVY